MSNQILHENEGSPGTLCANTPGASLDASGAIARKVRRHLLPFLFILYVIAYLDRINVGFAALTMNHELGLTSQQYGLLSGIFFWGYFLFEVPSNLILERIGARVWIARILITWGIVSLATGFAQSAMQLYVARFLLGIAEAGFFPGILLYLTYWFRQRDLAQHHRTVHDGPAGRKHRRRPDFRLDTRAPARLGTQQLALGADTRGAAGHPRRRA